MSEHSINLAYLPWIVDGVRKASFVGPLAYKNAWITHEQRMKKRMKQNNSMWLKEMFMRSMCKKMEGFSPSLDCSPIPIAIHEMREYYL